MATPSRQVIEAETGQTLLAAARWCDSFFCKLRGFTFRRQLGPGEGLVLVEKGNSRLNTSIHMLFVFVSLAVVWVNDAGIVVDTIMARPWHVRYTPQAPARYVIEAAPELLHRVKKGDRLQFLSP